MARAIGIDLGTTYSLVATMQAGEPVIIPVAEGGRHLPSVVALTKSGERVVGEMAKRQAVLNHENTVYSIKRLIGCRSEEESVKADARRLPYKIMSSDKGDVRVIMGGRAYTPQEVSAMILRRLKLDAEAFLGEEVTDAVVTVPAYFNDSQRQATKDAGTIAGLNVLRICSEPTAAALAYGLHKEEGGSIVVYDLGGGTLDISVLISGGGTFRVKATNGDTHLGGDDFDDRIIKWMCDKFREENGVDLSQDKMALQRIRDAAEKAKQELSTLEVTEINLPYIVAEGTGPKHLIMSLDRDTLESLVIDLISRTIDCCRRALADAHLSASQINEVLLVGGSTRMPRVQEEVGRFFGMEPRKGIDPDEAVVLGAAIYAGMLSGEVTDIALLDVTPLTLGIRTVGGVATPIIPRSSVIPSSQTRLFSTAADMQHSIEILVYQGESRSFDSNRMLGCFSLNGLPLAPAGAVKIEVTFNVDANGILNVTAKDKVTGKEAEITIKASSGLAEADIKRMAADLEARESAYALLRQADRLLKILNDRPQSGLKVKLEEETRNLREALETEDLEALNVAVQELTETVQRVESIVEKEQQPAEPPHPGNNHGPKPPAAQTQPKTQPQAQSQASTQPAPPRPNPNPPTRPHVIWK